MAIGNAGLLFRIDADSSGAKRELSSMETAVGGLGGKLGGMINPAALATAAITAMGTAAIAAAVGLVKLAFDASEYGSAIFDAQEKSGLTAATLSTLKLAADASGSSFEGITGSVSKFTVLLGQANQGNEKANATLAKYGVTARDVNGALEQAVAVIGREKDVTLQAAAAKDLFKDRSGALIPVIKQLGGDLVKATADAKRLGLVLGEDDVRAADDLGDAFGVLSAQVKAGAARFALQYAPQITAAIKTISDFLAANSGEWAKWGRDVYNAVTGALFIFNAWRTSFETGLSVMTFGLINNSNAWQVWAYAARLAIAVVTAGLSEVLIALSQIGALINGVSASGQGQWLDPVAAPQASTPKMPKMRGAGRGSSGGESAADKAKREAEKAEQEAERQRQKEVAAAERVVADTLAIYKAGYAYRTAELENALALGTIAESQYVRDVARIRFEAIKDEITLKKDLLKNDKFNADERAEIQQELKVLAIESKTEQLKGSTEVTEQLKKEVEALEELRKKEEERLLQLRQKRQEENFQRAIDRRDAAIKADYQNTIGSGQEVSGFDSLYKSAVEDLNGLDSTAAIAGIDALKGAFQGLGQAVGQVVQAWVLYGSAGTSVRKVTAQILAGIAQQAAIQAVFQLAEGFAKLAMAFFGVPNAGPSATAHFIAAGMYATVAGVAAVAGRAVAGNSFKDGAAGATGNNGGSGNDNGSGGNSSALQYTTPFLGYGQNNGQSNLLVRTLDRINTTLGLVEETQNTFNDRVTSMKPGEVVAMGAQDASRDIRDAISSELSSDVGTSNAFKRGLGFA